MIVERIWTGNSYRNFNYLIACPDTGEALAIDPLDHVKCLAAAKARGWKITQILNTHEHGDHTGGNAAMVADTTVRGYLDKMSDAFVIRQLQPWHENLSKRQVRAPKVYVRDSGLLHALLDIRTITQLDAQPKSGASWEGFVLEQSIQALRAASHECYFWRTHTGAELDLLVVRGRRRIGGEENNRAGRYSVHAFRAYRSQADRVLRRSCGERHFSVISEDMCRSDPGVARHARAATLACGGGAIT